MVLSWLISIISPLVLTQRKGHLASGSCAAQGRHRDSSPRRWMPRCLRGSTVVGPQGRDTRMGFAPVCSTLAAVPICKLVRVISPPVSLCHLPWVCRWGQETPTAPTGDTATGTCRRSPLWLSQVPSVAHSHFPTASLSLPRSSPPWGHSHKARSSSLESLIVFSLSFSAKAEIQ